MLAKVDMKLFENVTWNPLPRLLIDTKLQAAREAKT